MAFKFLPVVAAVFIINFGTAVAEDHDDCFNYNEKFDNGKKRIEIYNDCGINDSKTLNSKTLKCVAKAEKLLNKDGTINAEKLHRLIRKFANPEYEEKLSKIADESASQSAKELYSFYIKRVAEVCPKDKIFGNP